MSGILSCIRSFTEIRYEFTAQLYSISQNVNTPVFSVNNKRLIQSYNIAFTYNVGAQGLNSKFTMSEAH